MKKYDRFKTVHMIVTIVLAIIYFRMVMTNPDMSRKISTDSDVHALSVLAAVILGVSFVSIFIDFTLLSSIRAMFARQETLAGEDPLTGLSSRASIDSFISHYDKEGLPPHAAVLVVRIANISEINRNFSRADGDKAMQELADIMALAAGDFCYIGKNTGNSFIALFETATTDLLEYYMRRIDTKIRKFNESASPLEIKYIWGYAMAEEGFSDVHAMISKADRRSLSAQGEN